MVSGSLSRLEQAFAGDGTGLTINVRQVGRAAPIQGPHPRVSVLVDSKGAEAVLASVCYGEIAASADRDNDGRHCEVCKKSPVVR